MREILFRGKTKQGEWVQGGLIINNNGVCFIKDTDYHVNDGFIDLMPEKVTPETVGQYTGLNLNGIKLFEGDLFKLTFSDGYTVTKVIRYISEKGQFCVANINDLENEQYWDIWSGITKEWLDKVVSKCEVVGNIHDGEVK